MRPGLEAAIYFSNREDSERARAIVPTIGKVENRKPFSKRSKFPKSVYGVAWDSILNGDPITGYLLLNFADRFFGQRMEYSSGFPIGKNPLLRPLEFVGKAKTERKLKVSLEEQEMILPGGEFVLLDFLTRFHDHVISGAIVNEVSSSNTHEHIFRIRKRIEDDVENPTRLVTFGGNHSRHGFIYRSRLRSEA